MSPTIAATTRQGIAIQQMVFSVDQNLLHNPTAQEVWFLWRNECPRSVPPGTTIELK